VVDGLKLAVLAVYVYALTHTNSNHLSSFEQGHKLPKLSKLAAANPPLDPLPLHLHLQEVLKRAIVIVIAIAIVIVER